MLLGFGIKEYQKYTPDEFVCRRVSSYGSNIEIGAHRLMASYIRYFSNAPSTQVVTSWRTNITPEMITHVLPPDFQTISSHNCG